MKFVGQLVRHLGREERTFAFGRDLQSMALADEGDLAPDFVAHGDLVGSITMDVRTHCLPLAAALRRRRRSAPGEVRNTLLTHQIFNAFWVGAGPNPVKIS